MVVSQIHNNEVGVQEFPRATLIGATWMDGKSVREQERDRRTTPRKALQKTSR
jgi:hypothetical protein